MRNALAAAGQWAGRFCGVFLVYVVAGGLLGFAVAARGSNPVPVCWPFVSVFGVIQTECGDIPTNAFWLVTVELPRFIIVFPAVAISFLKAFLKNSWAGGDYHFLLESLWWTAISIPMALMSYVGFRDWRARSPVVAWVLVAALAGQILVLGLRIVMRFVPHSAFNFART